MAFKRWSRTKGKKAPTRGWTDEEMKIIGWCLNKNIGVSIMPDWKNELNPWQIDIQINNSIHTDPNRYEGDEVLDKVYEYYKYYYEKHI